MKEIIFILLEYSILIYELLRYKSFVLLVNA